MPDEFVVVVFHRGKHGVASVCSAQLVLSRRHAFDGDEKPTAVSNPLWNLVREFFADGQIHARNISKTIARRQTGKGAHQSPARTE
jgi:hypothetical protein